ncbi:hypothetical protein JCM10213_008662 [Rhodosporidiobolus nylandii]
MWPARLLIYASLALLLHSAYAAWLARTASKGTFVTAEKLLGSLAPSEVLTEALSAFVLLTVGILASAPSVKGVTWASEMAKRSMDSEDSGMGLANVRHRGAVLFGEKEGEE